MTEAELRARLKEAMRSRDGLAMKVLRGLLAGIKNKSIELKGEELSEADVLAILKRESKQYNESLDFARKSGREDAVREAEAAATFVASLLPAQLSEDELKAAIQAIIDETGADSMGPVMKELGVKHAGLYDGRLASSLVREMIAAK